MSLEHTDTDNVVGQPDGLGSQLCWLSSLLLQGRPCLHSLDQLADVADAFESLLEEGGLEEPRREGELDLLD